MRICLRVQRKREREKSMSTRVSLFYSTFRNSSGIINQLAGESRLEAKGSLSTDSNQKTGHNQSTTTSGVPIGAGARDGAPDRQDPSARWLLGALEHAQ